MFDSFFSIYRVLALHICVSNLGLHLSFHFLCFFSLLCMRFSYCFYNFSCPNKFPKKLEKMFIKGSVLKKMKQN